MVLSWSAPLIARRGSALRLLLVPITTTASMAVRPATAPPLSPATKKRNTLLTFGFLGTDFYGLQPQGALGDPDRPTVSDKLRRVLLEEGFLLESNFVPLERSGWQLASRTDKGVHAACAAATVKIETCPDDVSVGGCGSEPLGNAAQEPTSLQHRAATTAAATAADEPGGARASNPAGQPVETDWTLSRSALERINTALPPSVRVFSGSYVRKRFDPRAAASCRTYEYLLPVSAIGSSAAELDTALRCFEGTHRFHNFASGLRRSASDEQDFTCDVSGLSWPLALDSDAHTSAAYRSVLTCRVHREVSIGGEPYLVLRISGLAFVLHQIRHMVGAALAVTHNVVPIDVLQIGLRTALRVDVSPLAPGMGLLLDSVEWFNVRTGEYEARVPAAAREEMECFKQDVLYPHVHELYAQGAYDAFLDELTQGH